MGLLTGRALVSKKGRLTLLVLCAAILVTATGVARAYDVQETLTMPPNNLGLVGWWTFDGPTISGTTVTDVSGQGDNGTMEYSPPPVAGVEGQALSLNGSNQYVNCGTNDLAFNFASTSSFTESVWAYPTRVNGSWQAVFSVGRNLGLGNYQGIWLSGGNQWVFGSAGGGNLGTVYATPNKWVNITVVHTATSKAIYIDGVLNTTGAGDYINGDQGGALCGIGSWTQEYFAGSVDDMRVYNRALSPYETKQIYNAGTATHQNATVNPPNLQSGLVGHWTFDGPTISGTTIADVSGSGNNGTMVNGPAPVSGVEGQALSFNGTSQYVNVGSGVAPTSNFTISSWVYFSGFSSGALDGIVVNGASATDYAHYGLSLDANGTHKIRFWSGSGGGTTYIQTPSAVNTNIWYHVVGVLGGTGANQAKLYVNGSLVASGQLGNPVPSGNTLIGDWRSGYSYLDGSIDDVRIYNRALSATEITQLYDTGTANHQNATVNPPNLQSGLVGHWTFDGPTISGTTVKDVSGNANNGTMVNGPTPVAGVLGQALSFNGTSQYVATTQSESFPGAVTLTAWFKTTTSYTGTNWATPIGAASGGGNNLEIAVGNAGGGIGADNGAFVFTGSNPYAWANASKTGLNDGKWHLLVGERDPSGNMLVSVDGGAFVVGSNNTQAVSNDVFYLGTKNSSGTPIQYFNGSIDDVRAYNRALSASEVRQLYNLGR